TINSGSLSINQVRFIGSSCSQPGSGGAIAIIQQNSNSRISITDSSFTNCQTLTGSSRYGWGGAIYIQMGFEASDLSSTNFQLKDLSFTNCKASGAGNNLHILSDDTTAIGNQIKTGCLLTVKDSNDPPNIISDLYTNEQYQFDYMGINRSILLDNPGTIDLDLHDPLFKQFFVTIVPNPSYIDGINGQDNKFCGAWSSMCKTIKYCIERNPIPLSGIIPTDSTYSIILTSNTALDTNIQIMSTTLLNGPIMIQSDGYNPTEEYTKQSIQTQSFSSSLFTISGSGHLQLLGLHFDNLNPSSNNPLISISTDSDDAPQLQINDCEFESDAPYSQIYHSIISINGGIMSLVRTKIESYKLMNGISLINIKSDKVSTVTISQTTFTSIAQTGAGNGAVINAQLQQDCILKITDSCTFYNCSTQYGDNYARLGGAINARVDGSNSQFIVSDLVKFEKCQSFQGGAVSVELLNMGICVVNNVQFKECIVDYDGGGIFARLQNSGGTLTITNHTSFDQCINTVYGGGGINIVNNGLKSNCIISDNVIFEKCEAKWGGAIFIEQFDKASFEVHDVIFKKCEAEDGGAINIEQRDGASFDVLNVIFKECFSRRHGGAIYYQLWIENDISSFNLDGVQFINCQCQQQYGGSLLILMYSGITTINGSTFSGSQSIGIGGAIMVYIWYGAALVIENTQFESCNSTSSNGGSIYATINSGSLSINQVRFIGSSCSQPGSGGAIAIIQQNSNSRISIT
ncbi:MAG: hypothetical protein EZS28_037541, partial [Streblomastix strix]